MLSSFLLLHNWGAWQTKNTRWFRFFGCKPSAIFLLTTTHDLCLRLLFQLLRPDPSRNPLANTGNHSTFDPQYPLENTSILIDNALYSYMCVIGQNDQYLLRYSPFLRPVLGRIHATLPWHQMHKQYRRDRRKVPNHDWFWPIPVRVNP